MNTGFKEIDTILKGLKPGSYNLIGARPAMGKTSFALNIAMYVAMVEKKKVCYFSLDLSKEQLYNHLLLMQYNTNSTDFCENFIADTTVFSTVEQLQKTSREMQMSHGIDLIIIDDLQFISRDRGFSRRFRNKSKDGKISKKIKKLAEELQIPVILLTNVPRRIERRKNHRPKLADLGRSIKSVCDVLLYIYRDGYYDSDTEFKDIAEIIIAKNKYGDANRTVFLGWDYVHRSFQNM